MLYDHKDTRTGGRVSIISTTSEGSMVLGDLSKAYFVPKQFLTYIGDVATTMAGRFATWSTGHTVETWDMETGDELLYMTQDHGRPKGYTILLTCLPAISRSGENYYRTVDLAMTDLGGWAEKP